MGSSVIGNTNPGPLIYGQPYSAPVFHEDLLKVWSQNYINECRTIVFLRSLPNVGSQFDFISFMSRETALLFVRIFVLRILYSIWNFICSVLISFFLATTITNYWCNEQVHKPTIFYITVTFTINTKLHVAAPLKKILC